MTEVADAPVVTIDLETTMHCPLGNNAATPYWPANEVVLYGVKSSRRERQSDVPITVSAASPKRIIAGHHLPFDLGYLFRDEENRKEITTRRVVWDTQLAEYLLTGQQHKWASLDELAVKYGMPTKDVDVKAAFKKGQGAETIEPDVLKSYLAGDLATTEAVAIKQMNMAGQDRMAFFMSQMDALLATTEMSHNGLAIDLNYLDTEGNKIAARIKSIEDTVFDLEHSNTGLDPRSPTQLSKLLFGGTIKEKVKVADGVYKNGNTRWKTVEKETPVVGYFKSRPEWVGKNGVTSTSDEVLTTLVAFVAKGTHIDTLINAVLEYRALSKQLSTYFDGLRALIMPDGRIHHKLNHCATVTGRLSGTEPNMQNQPKHSVGDVKRAFVSRWGDDGCIVEADYKQLEMVALAVVSGDLQLSADIAAGIDTHSALFKEMHGRLPTDDERWSFKRCSFALVYGGGPTAIAAQGNTTVEEAKRFIKVFYARYPGVKQFHEAMVQWAKDNRVYEGDKDPDTGLPLGKAYYTSPTGRMFVFKEYPNSPSVIKWKKEVASFSPTELKNYPIQGLATGDIVPLVLGKLLRVLKNDPLLADKCLLINTVHDSIVFDVHKDVAFYAMKKIRAVMEQADKYMVETFDMDFPLKLKVEISYGPNWSQQTKEHE